MPKLSRNEHMLHVIDTLRRGHSYVAKECGTEAADLAFYYALGRLAEAFGDQAVSSPFYMTPIRVTLDSGAVVTYRIEVYPVEREVSVFPVGERTSEDPSLQ